MAKQCVRWMEWGQGAFEEAWAGGRPLFLLIKDSWSEVPDEAPRLLAEDPVLSALLNASFVPVLSDADAHPEVLSRYGFGGVPCACVLHADGNIVAGFERIELKELQSTLDRIYLDGVRDTARNIVSFYSNPAGAGFLDVRVQSGDSRMPCAPLIDPLQNARAAVFLVRASAQLEDPSLAAPAREILSALMEEESEDPTALGLVGSALIAILYPMPYYVAVTNGSEVHRTRVVDRIRGFGRPFPMIFHREPSPGEQMQTLPRLTAHCARQHEEISVP